MQLNISTFFEILQEDIQLTYFQSEYVSAKAFDVYFEIKNVNHYLKTHFEGISIFPIEVIFKPLVIRWIDQLQSKLDDWNQRMIELDQVNIIFLINSTIIII